MLKLINIKVNDDILEADYIPEDSDKKAHVSFNTKKNEANTEVIVKYGAMYGRMAINGLQRIASELESGKITDVPKERLVMWY